MQLGAAILQEGMLVVFYSCKLNSARCNYTVGEKEILSIVEALKEFCTMLYGCPNIHVFTDHKNNTFARLQTQRVLHWPLFMMTIPSNSTTSKAIATCLGMLCPDYLWMRGRKAMTHLIMPCLVKTKANKIYKLLQPHARGS
jgi:RNase H-like domain found in reverse transcriptase